MTGAERIAAERQRQVMANAKCVVTGSHAPCFPWQAGAFVHPECALEALEAAEFAVVQHRPAALTEGGAET